MFHENNWKHLVMLFFGRCYNIFKRISQVIETGQVVVVVVSSSGIGTVGSSGIRGNVVGITCRTFRRIVDRWGKLELGFRLDGFGLLLANCAVVEFNNCFNVVLSGESPIQSVRLESVAVVD